MAEKLPKIEWTVPVLDSEIPVSTENAGIGSTGAWASYAIGAVTKNLLKDQENKKFPFIEETEHPAHLTRESSEDSED